MSSPPSAPRLVPPLPHCARLSGEKSRPLFPPGLPPNDPPFYPRPPPAGGRGQPPERPAGPAVRGEGGRRSGLRATHLTFPGPTDQVRGLKAHVAPGPLPLPPEGRRGLCSPTVNRQTTHFRLSKAAIQQPTSVPWRALRCAGEVATPGRPWALSARACPVGLARRSRGTGEEPFTSPSMTLMARQGEPSSDQLSGLTVGCCDETLR